MISYADLVFELLNCITFYVVAGCKRASAPRMQIQ